MINNTAKLVLAALVAILTPMTTSAQTRLTVDGTEFVLQLPDGRMLRSADLVGATLTLAYQGKTRDITIAAVEDDHAAVGGRVVLHHFMTKDASGRSSDVCAPDSEGRSRGFPIPDGRGGFGLTCTSGAIGKCIRWGYRPFDERPDGPPLRALHQACVHMTRADYGGDGSTTTRDGTIIFMCDRYGVRRCDIDVPLSFEAAWGVDGAICVARPRVPDIISLAQLGDRYPRLKPRLGRACTEEDAKRDPAGILYNKS